MSEFIANQQALSALVGRRLSIWRRAANMLVLHFGQVTREDDKSWGEFALHVQCPWRLLKDGAVFAGLADLYSPRDETPDFDWRKWYEDQEWPDNLLEHQVLLVLKGSCSVTHSIENATEQFVVERVEASEIGDAKIFLGGGYVWECFPHSVADEHWRLLDMANQTDFVVSGQRPGPANKGAAPNGGPATPLGNSGVAEG